jgi:hypothetical protein
MTTDRDWLVLAEGKRIVARRGDLYEALNYARASTEARGWWTEVRDPDGVAHAAIIPAPYRAASIMTSLDQRNRRIVVERFERAR